MSALHPIRRNIKLRNSRLLCQSQDGYFLFFRFRIATISSATVKTTMNSSYVLIIITSSERSSDRVRARPPAPLVSILYCQCSVVASVGVFTDVPIWNRFHKSVENYTVPICWYAGGVYQIVHTFPDQENGSTSSIVIVATFFSFQG